MTLFISARRNALFETYEPLIAAALISAHFAARNGFRQRDVRFYVELFSNWVAYFSPDSTLGAGNTQIARYIRALEEGGFVRPVKGRGKAFALTRVGIIELLRRFSARIDRIDFGMFLFMHFFLTSYAPRIEALIKSESQNYPPSFQIEVRALLDHEHFLTLHRRAVETQLRKIEERIRETEAAERLSSGMYRRGSPHTDVVRAVEKQFPYQLNSQKRFSTLMGELSESDGAWELTEGNERRLDLLWRPIGLLLQSYLKILNGVG